MLGWFKTVGGLMAPYLLWIKIGVVVALLISVVTFVSVCHGRGVKLDHLRTEREQWVVNRAELNRELVSRNERIQRLNEERLQAIAVAEQKIRAARSVAATVAAERDRVSAELARVLLENHNDEVIVELADCPVPGVAWNSLRDLASPD